MSGIFGIFNRNGKDVDKKILNDMLEATSYWKPDEHATWIEGSTALGHTMLWNTPESKYEHLPLEKDAYVLTMDARIDNRDELVKELELPECTLEEIGDSEFILAAYRKWGEECPKHLLGDFSFAIWDKKKQQIFCARDPFGIKLFYYYRNDGLFVFSNDILGVISHCEVPKEYDEQTLSLFLRDNGVNTLKDTFFAKIKKLPGGTSLTISVHEIREQTYWKIENSPLVHYDTYQEYVDALRRLIESAVEIRLRTTYPVVSHLSGGIDSSPISVLAARKLHERKQSLHAYNWIDIPEDSEAYETEAYEFSRRIAKLEQIEHHEFTIDPSYKSKWWDRHDITTKGTMSYIQEYYVQNETEKIGGRTILSGWGGDEFISYNGYRYISGLFKQGEIFRAIKTLYREKNFKKHSWYRIIKKYAYEMDIPLLRKYIQWKNKEPVNIYESNDYVYIKADFKKVMEKYHFEELPNIFGIRNRQSMFFQYGHIQSRIESWALSSFSTRTEYAYPLLDRRIVEFAFGIPEEMFFTKDGHYRHLMRSAVADLLPSDIAWFPKPYEIKISITYKKQYEASLEQWFRKHKSDDSSLYDNPYIDYKKILANFETFDFYRSDPHNLHKIVNAILLANIMKK